MKYVALQLIRLYQKYFRHFYRRRCIYVPTCSNYAIEAIAKYGVMRGSYYTFKRIKRCNGALYAGGYDPL